MRRHTWQNILSEPNRPTARDTGVQFALLGGAESCRREQSALEDDRGVSWYTSEAVQDLECDLWNCRRRRKRKVHPSLIISYYSVGRCSSLITTPPAATSGYPATSPALSLQAATSTAEPSDMQTGCPAKTELASSDFRQGLLVYCCRCLIAGQESRAGVTQQQ